MALCRVAIWGTGNVYYEYENLLHCYELLGEIIIEIFISKRRESVSFKGRPLVSSTDFFSRFYDDVDFIVVASAGYNEIINEAEKQMGGVRDKIFNIEILKFPGFSWEKYIYIRRCELSIVSENCIGGILSNTFGLKHLSPFVNMSVKSEDYFKLIKRINYYMGVSPEKSPDVVYGNDIYYKCWRDRIKGHEAYLWYDDIMLRGTHYPNNDIYYDIFNKRRKRFNFNNYIVFKILYSEDDLLLFEKIKGRKLGLYYIDTGVEGVVTIPLLSQKEMSNYDYRYDALIISMFQNRSILRYVDFFELLSNDRENRL